MEDFVQDPFESQLDQEQLDNIWDQLKSHMHPFVYVLCLDGDFYRMLDAGAKRFIAHKFMNQVLEPIMYCKDGTGFDRYFLGASRHFVAGKGTLLCLPNSEPVWVLDMEATVASVTASSPPFPARSTRIPRPPNAYILYRKERHSMVKAANPGITNNEISQVLGRAWNVETREVREKYKAMSEQIKQALLAKHPDYQYKPRKPSERKKRSRRNAQSTSAGASADGDVTITSPESTA